MRNYELMYILRPNMEDENRKEVNERFQAILTDNGAEIENVDDMGKRRLEYEINDFKEGYYVVVNFKGGAEAVNEFDRLAKISDDIIRFMIIRPEA